jgi:hypothetical protein
MDSVKNLSEKRRSEERGAPGSGKLLAEKSSEEKKALGREEL